MQKAMLIGLLAAVGAFAGVLVNATRLNAAGEVKCRVDVEAFVRDVVALKKVPPDIDSEFIKQLLQPKKP